MLLRAKENAFIGKKQKSTPKKRIFRVPYAVKESPSAIKQTAKGNKRAVGLTSFYSRASG